MTRPLENRIALVTGASRGIGHAVALELARQGAHVVALARTQGALEELDDAIRAAGSEATLVPCDITDFDALDRLGLALHERWGKLDILVANAALLGSVTPLSHIDPPKFDQVMAVNVTANWRLVRSLDVLLRASDAGRAVFLTTGAVHGETMRPYLGQYAITKMAMETLARTYASETATTSNVKVMVANPGPLRTKMRAALMPGEDPMTLRTPEEFAPKLAALCQPGWTQTDCIYDFPTDRIKHWRAPE